MRIAILAVCLWAVGCGAPEPLLTRDLDDLDRPFAGPPRTDASKTVSEILKKTDLSLEDALTVADLMNPTLAVERKQIDLATAAIWESKLYPNPALVMEVEEYATRNGSFGNSERTAGIRLPVVVGGRIGAASSLAEKEREAAAVTYVWKRRQILGGVKRAFVAALAARRTAGLIRETRGLAQTLHDATSERFKVGAVPEMEVLKSAVQLAKAESDLRQAEREFAVAVKSLHALMGDVDFPIDRIAGDLVSRFTVPSLESLRGPVTTTHPLLEAAARSREAAELQRSLAEAERIPDVGVEFAGGKSAEDETIVNAGLEIQLPLFNRNQAKIAAAEIRMRQAELQAQAVRNDLILKLTESHRAFTSAQDRVNIYADEILPKAGKALDQTNEGHRLGKFTHLDVLDALRTLAEARIAYAAALRDLNESATDLELVTGMAIEPVR